MNVRRTALVGATAALILGISAGSASASTTKSLEAAPQQSGAVVCNFLQVLDSLHYSSTDTTFGTLSIHGSWENVDCKAGTTATVTTQLQKKDSSGKWVDVGSKGVNKKAYSGGGSANRSNSRYVCTGKVAHTYRAWVDVDLNGIIDASNKLYSPETVENCS